jgi:hypothetical protein
MANQQLIRGARQAADKFTDVTGQVRQAVLRGEQALLRRKAEEQRLQENNARAIAQLPQLDESQVPMQMREWATGEAMKLRDEAISAISNPDLSPVEKQMAISQSIAKINSVAAKTNDFKQWIVNVADLQQEDLSKLNSETLYSRINDIYEGNFKVADGKFIFSDGEEKDFNSLVNTRPITRRSDAYQSQVKALGEQFEKYALQGWNEDEFNSKIDQVLSDEKYTDGDIASIAVDELGLSPELAKNIQDDFEDNGRLDKVNKEELVFKIKEQYKIAAKTAYDRAKSLYDRKTAIKKTEKPPKPTDPNIILGAGEAAKLLNNPSEYFRSVSGDKTNFNETTREFSLITYDKDGNEVPIVYDLLNQNDITRLFNEIQNNKSYTASARAKLEEGLRRLIASPQFAEYQKKGEAERRPTTGPIQDESTIDYNQFLRPSE